MKLSIDLKRSKLRVFRDYQDNLIILPARYRDVKQVVQLCRIPHNKVQLDQPGNHWGFASNQTRHSFPKKESYSLGQPVNPFNVCL
jgi:hypothetical protein